MKKRWYILFFIFSIAVSPLLMATSAQAAVSNWQKGASTVPRSDTDYASDSFKQSMRDLKATNSNYVTMVIPLYQSNIYATNVEKGWNTPTNQALIDGINYAHSIGLKVNLKPHVDSYDGQWRASINPGDRNAWFGSYGFHLKNYAQIAADHGVEQMTIGSELINMAAHDANGTNTQKWNALIAEVRAIFGGQLTYSANWGGPGWTDEKNRIQFWSNLDKIGISAYYPLATNDTSVNGFKQKWGEINANDITPLQQKYNKPVIFTEVGYRSLDWAHWAPYEYNGSGTPDQGEQARLYEALYSYWNEHGTMEGVHWWDWSTNPNAGGQGNIDYTPQNKQAEEVMRTWNGSEAPTPPPTPEGDPKFASAARIHSSTGSVKVGQTFSISADIQNTGTAASNILVDIEIFNESGQRVFQEFKGSQQFAHNETKTYTITWTPDTVGKYSVAIGIFNNSWTKLYRWDYPVATFNVIPQDQTPPPTTPPTPTNYSINIWWPTDGKYISGTQPYKAMIEGLNISEYTMYWQVDGDTLNIMANSLEDYPHKESLVNVSTWNWRGSGPYTLTFVAKDKLGKVIATKDITIYVE